MTSLDFPGYRGFDSRRPTIIRSMKDNVKRRKALYFYVLSVDLDFRLIVFDGVCLPPPHFARKSH